MTRSAIRLLSFWTSGLATGFAIGGILHLHVIGLLP